MLVRFGATPRHRSSFGNTQVSMRDRDIFKRFLSGDHETTAEMKMVHAAEHR
jgi:hypothetical protein